MTDDVGSTSSSPSSPPDVTSAIDPPGPLSPPLDAAGPSTPPTASGPVFHTTHSPAVRGRNRASSISFDLNPFKRLHRSLEHDHAHALEATGGEDDEHTYGTVADDEAGPDDSGNPWRQGFDKEEVRRALGELLFHVEGLTTRLHAALSRQLETEHELKIARSNLMLTEANVEMLEESIRRGGQFGQAMMQQTQRRAGPPPPLAIPTSDTPVGLSSPVQLSLPPLDRSISDSSTRTRTQTDSLSSAPPPSPGGSAPTGGWLSKWGFSPSQSESTKSTSPAGRAWVANESEVPRSGLGQLAAAGSTPNLPGSLESAAHVRLHRASATDSSQAAAVTALKASLAEAHTLSTSLAKELAAVKDAKASLEGELEDLTGQLFEEANLLVAEERQRAAAREDEANEARREREVMRQTVKVVEEDCRVLREMVESMRLQQEPTKRIPLKKGSNRSLRSNLSAADAISEMPVSPWAEEDNASAASDARLSALMNSMSADGDDGSALATPTSATFPPPPPSPRSPERLRAPSPTPSFRSHVATTGSISGGDGGRMPKSPSASSFKSFSSNGSASSNAGGYRPLSTEASAKGRRTLLLPQTQD